MILPFYIGKSLKAYFAVASEDRRALLNTELFNTDPLTCKKEYLPLLAVEAGVEIDGFAEPIQRKLIANAFKSFDRVGTIGALKGALNAIAPIEIEERENFVFSVKMPYLQDGVYSKEHFSKILNTVNKSKNVRSVFKSIELDTESKTNFYFTSALNINANINKEQLTLELDSKADTILGVAVLWQV